MSIAIPWGREDELRFELPEGWRLDGVVEPASLPPVVDVPEALARAIESPRGLPPLSRFLAGKRSVAVIVDDASRPTPARLFMTPLLDAVKAAGIAESNITLVTGTGTHRAMSEREMEAKVGAAALAGTRWLNHDFRDSSMLEKLGRTSRGTPVELNRAVVSADAAVLVGTIEPHPHAGFGGGYKNIIPGIAGASTIGKNHMLSATRHNFGMVGWEPADDPMRLDIEEAGKMLSVITPCFLVNTVLTPDLDVAGIVAGDPVEAHREGMALSKSMYGVPVDSQADVVISGSHPMDHDLRQGVKAVANTFRAVREGGLLIAAMRCEQGAGDIEVPNIRVPRSLGMIRTLAAALVPVVKYMPFGIPVEERFYMYTALRIVLRNRVKIFAPEIDAGARQKLSTFLYTCSFDEALAGAAAEFPGARVLVFPKGGVTYPVLERTTGA